MIGPKSLKLKYKNQPQLVEEEVAPALQIPDDNPAGIESSITINENGVLKSIVVDVDITHTFNGDLQIDLTSPSRKTIQLRSANGKRGYNVIESYSDKTVSALTALIGEQVGGDWILGVTDLAKIDTGTLNKWGLSLRFD